MSGPQRKLNGPDDAPHLAASEIFQDLLCDGSTPVADCDLCGRTHYDAGGEHMDDGELASLERKHAERPDIYVFRSGAVSYGNFNGQQVVWRCQCNRMGRFERFFWEHRHLIADYMRRRVAHDASELAKTQQSLAAIEEAAT